MRGNIQTANVLPLVHLFEKESFSCPWCTLGFIILSLKTVLFVRFFPTRRK